MFSKSDTNGDSDVATSMLETKCVDDNFKMLVTLLAILVTNILYDIGYMIGYISQY